MSQILLESNPILKNNNFDKFVVNFYIAVS